MVLVPWPVVPQTKYTDKQRPRRNALPHPPYERGPEEPQAVQKNIGRGGEEGVAWVRNGVNGNRIYAVEDKRPLCQLSSKRLEDNWQSGILSYTKQLGLYKMFIHSKAICRYSIIRALPPPSALLTLLQYYRTTIAQYANPTRPLLCMVYTIPY